MRGAISEVEVVCLFVLLQVEDSIANLINCVEVKRDEVAIKISNIQGKLLWMLLHCGSLLIASAIAISRSLI